MKQIKLSLGLSNFNQFRDLSGLDLDWQVLNPFGTNFALKRWPTRSAVSLESSFVAFLIKTVDI